MLYIADKANYISAYLFIAYIERNNAGISINMARIKSLYISPLISETAHETPKKTAALANLAKRREMEKALVYMNVQYLTILSLYRYMISEGRGGRSFSS